MIAKETERVELNCIAIISPFKKLMDKKKHKQLFIRVAFSNYISVSLLVIIDAQLVPKSKHYADYTPLKCVCLMNVS